MYQSGEEEYKKHIENLCKPDGRKIYELCTSKEEHHTHSKIWWWRYHAAG